MLVLSWAAVWSMRKGRGVEGLPKPLLYGFVGMAFSGWIATLAGWYTTEIGRQPWLVDGVLKTADAVAEVPAPMVLTTLIAYLVVYAALIFCYMGVITYLAIKAARGEAVLEPRRPGTGFAPAATPAE